MQKEIIISVLIGLTLGLIITFGVYRFRTSMSNDPTTSLESVVTVSPTPDAEVASVVTIHSPLQGSVLTENDLTITGNTIPDSYVVVFVNDTELISTSDPAGNFSFQVKLADGPNIIRVHVVDDDGTATVAERSVIVADLEAAEPATPSTEESES